MSERQHDREADTVPGECLQDRLYVEDQKSETKVFWKLVVGLLLVIAAVAATAVAGGDNASTVVPASTSVEQSDDGKSHPNPRRWLE